MLGNEMKYPVTDKAIDSQRTRAVDHPWNRGYPNNRFLRERLAALDLRLEADTVETRAEEMEWYD